MIPHSLTSLLLLSIAAKIGEKASSSVKVLHIHFFKLKPQPPMT